MTSASPIRLLIVDDHATLRRGLIMVLDRAEGMEVVGEAGDGQQAVELACRLQPDVILVDVRMPTMDGPETTRRLVEAGVKGKIIALSMYDEAHIVERMMEAGAVAYVNKAAPVDELVNLILQVHQGGNDKPAPPRQ